MQKADQLIRTKLHLPFIRPGLVIRPRLQEKIQQGLCGPLTIITAPAGFGKTTLVASCVIDSGMPVAWLSLDKDDNLIGRFLSYLIAALQEADPLIGGEAAQLAMRQQAPAEAVLTSLVNDLDSAGVEKILVLDDYQFINRQDIHDEVAFLLEHCPPTFHLVIATRSDPPFPMARLRARGQTVELRAADLRFTEIETAQFLNDVMRLQLDAESVAALEEHTEGWVAGLQMASIALQSHISTRGRKDVPAFIKGFSGTNRFILDYLLEEVLAHQPETVQTFLLQTAILHRLAGPLCDAVTHTTGSQEMLEWLEKRNLFIVPLDEERHWYRYHHLFADLLQARLNQSGQAQVSSLLTCAAEWCEQDGQIAEAASYAIAAQDYGRVTDLFVKYWQRMANNGEIETVVSWLRALPEDVITNSASLSVAFCMVLWLNGQVGAIEAHLVNAERAFAKMAARGEDNPAAAAEMAELAMIIAAQRSFVARYNEQFEIATAMAQRALDLIPENLPPLVNAQLRSLALLALVSAYDSTGRLEEAVEVYAEIIHCSQVSGNASGVAGLTYRISGALWWLGRLRAADAACREALDYLHAHAMEHLPAVGVLHVAMSQVLIEQNDLETAEAHLARGIALGKWSGRMDAMKNAAYALSRLRQARQDPSGALEAIQQVEAAQPAPIPPLLKAELLAFRARVLLKQGAVREAAECIEAAEQLTGRDQGQTRAIVTLAACRVVAARYKPDETIAHLSRSLASAEAGNRPGMAIELRILRSLAFFQQDKIQEAEADLERAMALAEPEGYVRIFLDEGQSMRQLLAHWLAHASAGPLRGYAIHLFSEFDTEPHSTAAQKSTLASSLIEPLSQRELEVLQLMALGRTNEEIAQQLIVARGTIKAHAASIYRKLDVANRTEAVAHARQIGLLR